jgi:hypothetical protein
MPVREFADQKSLIDYAERNGLVYLRERMPAFARRQRMVSPLPAFTKRQQMLSPDQYEIVRIAREKFPFLPADQAFARVFEDKNYAALAAQAHRRPGPTTVYAMPRAAAYTKSDPVPNTNTLAYAELMAKAEQLRSERPELSVAQAFEKVYTNRANVELALRERRENAAR